MRSLNSDQLKALYFNYADYRDRVCGGHANMSVRAFHEKHGLTPHE
jgi:hypothetical protein